MPAVHSSVPSLLDSEDFPVFCLLPDAFKGCCFHLLQIYGKLVGIGSILVYGCADMPIVFVYIDAAGNADQFQIQLRLAHQI